MSDRIINGDARSMDVSRFGRYKLIIADPPWSYNDQRKIRKDRSAPTRGIGACHHYELMNEQELSCMPVDEISQARCLLFMWATSPRLDQAIRVMAAWGFTYVTVAFTWVKMNPGMWRDGNNGQLSFVSNAEQFMNDLTFFGPGYYTGSNVELVLLGRKGEPSYPHAVGHKASQVVYAPRGDEHSQKPESIQGRIEWMYPDVTPRIEMFARRERAGWDMFGNEV